MSDGTFDEEWSGLPSRLIDFWAEWCGPCRLIAPVVEEIANEPAGRLVVGKLDVDEHADLARATASRASRSSGSSSTGSWRAARWADAGDS